MEEKLEKRKDGRYEYRGCTIWRNESIPDGEFGSWKVFISGLTFEWCTSLEDAMKNIDDFHL